MKIVSYALWGQDPKYCVGAIKNAELCAKFYPDWKCRFYCDCLVDEATLSKLSSFSNCEVIIFNEVGDWRFSVKRFIPMSEDIERMISRDTDSRISERERLAVDAWIFSGKSAHIMRDHPSGHTGFPMLAGMFGIIGNKLPNIGKLLSNYIGANQYHYDQRFLAEYVFPVISNDVLIHTDFDSRYVPFPSKRDGNFFVGESFGPNGERNPRDYSSIPI